MDYKQKYKEALERAKECMKDGGISQNTIDYLCNIFPELKESEDERIKQSIIADIKSKMNNCTHTLDDYYREQIAWLEKQGKKTQQTPRWMINFLNENRCKFASSMDDYDEQREAGGKLDAIINWLEKQKEEKVDNANKIVPKFKVKYAVGEYNVVDEKDIAGVTFYGIEDEPNHIDYIKADTCEIINAKLKFKVGDWVVYDHRTYQVVELPKEGYINLGLRRNGKIEFAPSTYCRPWTIKDANDGDVLVDAYGNIGIYEKCGDYDWTSYCSLGCYGGFQSFSVLHENDKTHPATKEQRDTLFAEMREAGYEWDAEKKLIYF